MAVKAIDVRKNISIMFIALFLAGCDQSTELEGLGSVQISPAGLQLFISEVKSNLVYVEGGKFLMGDFGYQHGRDLTYYDADPDSKPLHDIELSSFSISKFKVTNAEFQFYIKSMR